MDQVLMNKVKCT